MKGKHASYLQHWLIQNGRPEGAKLQLHGLLLSSSDDCLLISQKRYRSAGFCSTFRGEQRSANYLLSPGSGTIIQQQR